MITNNVIPKPENQSLSFDEMSANEGVYSTTVFPNARFVVLRYLSVTVVLHVDRTGCAPADNSWRTSRFYLTSETMSIVFHSAAIILE